MKLLYEASNSIEAHMILNLLEHAGLSARIDGEYLQGGVGELQAIGIVRVMTEEADFAKATLIIEEWDTKQPAQKNKSPIQSKSSFGTGIVGFIFGIAAMSIYYQTPVTTNGVDYNGDGELDEKRTYINHRISKTELDRNFDSNIDLIYSFDRRGIIESSSSDEDFNGTFETEIHYDYGRAVWQKSDTTGDGFKDYKIDFRHGVPNTISFFDPVTKKVIKIQEYDPIKLRKATVDTTGNGVLDTVYEYDVTEEISNNIKNIDTRSR